MKVKENRENESLEFAAQGCVGKNTGSDKNEANLWHEKSMVLRSIGSFGK